MSTQDTAGKINGFAIAVLMTAILSGILIWVVGLLGLGRTVDGFLPALIAGIAIAVVGGVITSTLMALGLKVSNELLRMVINIILGAVVLLVCGRLLPGLTVDGFAGALLASIAIGVIAWLLSLIPRRINQAAAKQE